MDKHGEVQKTATLGESSKAFNNWPKVHHNYVERAGLDYEGGARLASSISFDTDPRRAAAQQIPNTFGSVPPPSIQAASFLASLGPPPSVPCQAAAQSALLSPPLPSLNPGRKVSGMQAAVVPPSGGSNLSVDSASSQTPQQMALAAAMRLAETLSGSSASAAIRNVPPLKSLDELLACDRVRIAAADQKNLQYVLEKEANAKAEGQTQTPPPRTIQQR